MSSDRSRPWVLLAAVLLLLSSSPAAAITNAWTSHGPEGGYVSSLIYGGRPGTIYAGRSTGVMKSVDGGRTWRWILTGSLASGPFYLALDPTDPETLYVGAREEMYKSSNAGATWSRLAVGTRGIHAVALSPAAPQTIWVAGVELRVSRDGGASWGPVGGGYPSAAVPRVVVTDPVHSGIVYVSHSSELDKTTDGGDHWAQILDNDPAALAIDPAQPWKIYAGNFTRFYEGVLRSADSGNTWTHLGLEDYYASVLAIDPATSAIYAATVLTSSPRSILRSTNSGRTWINVGSSLPSTMPTGFAFDPYHPAAVYYASAAGVWKSSNRGRTWTPASGGMGASIESLAFAPSAKRILYAGSGVGGLFKSINRGRTWNPVLAKNLNVNTVSNLRVHPDAPEIVFATTDRGLYKSLDGGLTWRRLGSMAPVYDLVLDPTDPSTLYAATSEGAFRSRDGGETWSLVWSPGPGQASWVYHLTVSSGGPWDVYLTSASGLFASSDRGDTWTQIPYSTEEARRVTVDPMHPNVVYVNGERTITKSTDGGQTWSRADFGIPTASEPVILVAVDPLRPHILYCATWRGVFLSSNGGASWSRLGGAFQDSLVTGLVLDASGGTTTLHVSTRMGVFTMTRTGQ